jgi:hypothetical protein
MSELNDEAAFFRRVWAQLRRGRFSGSQIVFMPESNLRKEASHMEMFVRFDQNTVVLREASGGWYGVQKTHKSTIEMHAKLRYMMAAKQIVFASDMVGIPTSKECASTGISACTPAAAAFMRAKLMGQLKRYRWVETSSSRTRTEIDEIVRTLTGKSGKLNDDLCVCALMIPYWKDVFWMRDREEYERAKRAILGRNTK